MPVRIRFVLATWVLLAAACFTVAGIPGYRAAWSTTVPVHASGDGLLLSDPIVHFVTPFISSAQVRFRSPAPSADLPQIALIAGAEPPASLQDVNRRALIIVNAGDTRPRQFRPAENVRVAVLGSNADGDAEVTLGYDGQSAVVSVAHYWWPWMAGCFLLGSWLLLSPVTWKFQAAQVDRFRRTFRDHQPVAWLLLAAAVLRFALVVLGGQYFDWDEVRYGGGAAWAFSYLSTGNFNAALGMVLKAPDHPAFRIVGVIPAFFHVITASRAAQAVTEMRYPSGEWLPAFLLSLASVASIALTYAIAYRSGACRRESFLAALLMFASASMLIYARHFFPYDASMAILLFALWIGLRTNDTPLLSFNVGLLSGFGFLTYEGYWLMAIIVGGVHALREPWSPLRSLKRYSAFVTGFIAPVMLLVAAGYAEGQPFLEKLHRFSQTAVNGDFSEGWSLPWAYLWHAEHAVLLVYALGILLVAMNWMRRGAADIRYPRMWMAAALAIYCGLVVGSNALHRFVVYDRVARQMLPFVCLAAAAGLMRLTRTPVLYGIIILLFAANVAPLLAQRFPRDMVSEAIRRYGLENVRLEASLLHLDNATAEAFLPPEIRAPLTASARAKRYVLLNTVDIWPKGGELEEGAFPAGRQLLVARHPRQLRLLQYHGYTPVERRFLRSTDFSMRLIDTEAF